MDADIFADPESSLYANSLITTLSNVDITIVP